MIGFALAVASGATWVLQLDRASSADILAGLAIGALPVVLAVWLFARRRFATSEPRRLTGFACRLVSGGLAGVLLGTSAVQSLAARRLPDALHGQLVTVTGTIVGLPKQDSRRVRFDIALGGRSSGTPRAMAAALDRLIARDTRWRLSWYDPPLVLRSGESLRFTLLVKRPYALANPGGRDHVRDLLRADVTATGVVRRAVRVDTAEREIGGAPGARLRAGAEGFRTRVSAAVSPADDPPAIRGLVAALTVGDGSRIEPATRDVLERTGTAHLLAISGLHITLVAGLGFWLGRIGWTAIGCVTDGGSRYRQARAIRRAGPRGPGAIDRDFVASGIGLACATGYAVIAGLSLPTQRAIVMLVVALVWLRSRRAIPFAFTWTLALLAVLLVDVVELLSVGLWLSFGTVVVLAWLHAGRPRPRGRVRAALDGHLRLGIVMLPIGIACFGTGSLVAPVANVLAVPVVGFVVVPLALVAAVCTDVDVLVGLAEPTLRAARAVLSVVMSALAWLSELPLAAPGLAFASPAMAVGAITGALLLFAPAGLGVRGLALSLALPGLWFNVVPRHVDGFEVHVLDVGQGTAALVLTATHTVLVDTGDLSAGGHSRVDDTILPTLHRLGRRRIDRIVVSHADRDHAGGVADLARHYSDARWYASRPAALAHPAENRCRAGDGWLVDGVWFSFLHPTSADRGSDNDLSCVLLVHHGAARALFPGDIEASGEARLLARGAALPVTLLLAPHHGSGTSSSDAFVAGFGADHVVHTAGRDNRFGFPHEAVRMRYTVAGAHEHITGRDGAIAFRFDRRGLVAPPTRWQARHRRWWHDGPASRWPTPRDPAYH